MKRTEIYVTEVEQEAYDLSGQLALAQVRSHVEAREFCNGDLFWMVVGEADEAFDRARAVRQRMFGS